VLLVSGDMLLETDFQPSDTYLLIAVHTLLDIWHDTGVSDASSCRICCILTATITVAFL